MDNTLPTEPSLSDAELRILRLLVGRASRSRFDFASSSSDGGRTCVVDREPLLTRTDFRRAGLPVPPPPDDGHFWFVVLFIECGLIRFEQLCQYFWQRYCPLWLVDLGPFAQTFALTGSFGALRPFWGAMPPKRILPFEGHDTSRPSYIYSRFLHGVDSPAGHSNISLPLPSPCCAHPPGPESELRALQSFPLLIALGGFAPLLR